MLRFLTAGESHGQRLTVIVDGLPAGLEIAEAELAVDLKRRQHGHGRGGRMAIEQDVARIISGVRGGRTIGSPVTMDIGNRDWPNWERAMSVGAENFEAQKVTRVRPGHADLAGLLKYGAEDVRDVLERASARETASRVALGGVAKGLLRVFGMTVHSYVRRIGPVEAPEPAGPIDWERVEASPVRTFDPDTERAMVQAIDDAGAQGDTLGGIFTVIVHGAPPGLGSYRQWDTRLDGQLAQALMSIPACKAVELGIGVAATAQRGSEVHDSPVARAGGGFQHLSNRAGGLTGGISNGEDIIAHAMMKPLSTLKKPLPSVDVASRQAVEGHYERSDVCVVPAAGIVGEAMAAIVMACATVEKFGGDSVKEMRRNYDGYLQQIRT
jgi:chorismate synthase